MLWVAVGSIIVGFVVGFFISAGYITRSMVRERLTALGITRNTPELFQESVKIIMWLRSEDAAMTGITYDSEVRQKMDTFLAKVKKDYL